MGGGVKVVEWRQGWTPGAFESAVAEAGGHEPGAVVELTYLHDGDCPKLEGGACRCEPDVVAAVHSPTNLHYWDSGPDEEASEP